MGLNLCLFRFILWIYFFSNFIPLQEVDHLMLFLAEKTSSSFTAAGTQAIMWISEIVNDLYPALISRYFDHCGINYSEFFHFFSFR